MTSFRNLSLAQRGLILTTVVIAASLALFGLAEIGLRVRHRLKFGSNWGIEDTFAVDQKSGLRIPVRGGVFGGIRINSLGFRGPEITDPKPPSTLRVAFLGSSTTYCAEVSNNEKAWPHLVTRELQAKWPNIRFDYVNAGVPGYGVSDSLKNLDGRVARLSPDVIVIYEGHNDLSFNSFELAVKQGIASKRTEQTLSWPTKYSLLWYLVEKNLMILGQTRAAQKEEGKLKLDMDAIDAPFRHDLKELVAASQRVAKLVVLVTFSTRLRPEQDPAEQSRAAVTSLYYMPYMSTRGLIDAYASYNEVVRQVAREAGALLIDGENSIPPDGAHFVDSVHFTDEGSRLMAERVGHAMAESGALQQIITGGFSHLQNVSQR